MLNYGYDRIMKIIKIRIIAFVAFGVLNLLGFVYVVGQGRYHAPVMTPEYDGYPSAPQDLSSWFSGARS
jgi:hypothetical protein